MLWLYRTCIWKPLSSEIHWKWHKLLSLRRENKWLELPALTKAFKSMVDLISFWTKFDMSAWMFVGRIKPAECKVDWITIAAVQVMMITSVAVSYANQITVLLQPNHWVMCVWPHVLYSHNTQNSKLCHMTQLLTFMSKKTTTHTVTLYYV